MLMKCVIASPSPLPIGGCKGCQPDRRTRHAQYPRRNKHQPWTQKARTPRPSSAGRQIDFFSSIASEMYGNYGRPPSRSGRSLVIRRGSPRRRRDRRQAVTGRTDGDAGRHHAICFRATEDTGGQPCNAARRTRASDAP
jgi:hypothetical protein